MGGAGAVADPCGFAGTVGEDGLDEEFFHGWLVHLPYVMNPP